MKILHTSDWHLGQKLLYRDREEEHQLALDWLADLIVREQVEGLIVAGDIFDIGNPPNYARKLYYRFLAQLWGSPCRHVLIIGGNHDSPAMLDAPRDVLEALHIHVVGAATGNLEDEIVEWRHPNGELEAVIAAVPFLRDRDLRFSESGEGGYERINAISDALVKHYEALAEFILQKKYPAHIPLLATGHLYAAGAMASEPQNNIYLGNVENMTADQFPDIFRYLALGHIHRPQSLGAYEHIRYSGSLIPLSFSEVQDNKSVAIIHWNQGLPERIETIELPVFRRLKTISGAIEEIKESLIRFDAKDRAGLKPWVEIVVDDEQLLPQLDVYFQDFTGNMHLDVLKIRILRNKAALDSQQMEEHELDLDQLAIEEVFIKKCEAYGCPPEEINTLGYTFKELKEWMDNRGD